MIEGNRVPLLARMIYNANKQLIGKVDDVFGPMHTCGIAINVDTNSGVKAESFKSGDKVSVHFKCLYPFIYDCDWSTSSLAIFCRVILPCMNEC